MKHLLSLVLLLSVLSINHAHAMQMGLELGSDVESYNMLEVVATFTDGKHQKTGRVHRFYTPQGSRLHAQCPQDEITISTPSGDSAYVKLLEVKASSVVLTYNLNMRGNLAFLFGNTPLKSVAHIEIPYTQPHSSGIFKTGYVHDLDQRQPAALALTIAATLATLQK